MPRLDRRDLNGAVSKRWDAYQMSANESFKRLYAPASAAPATAIATIV